jgi:hypothetical protein
MIKTSRKLMAKSHQKVSQIFCASTSPNFVRKCFVKWLFSFFVICEKKLRVNNLMKLMPGYHIFVLFVDNRKPTKAGNIGPQKKQHFIQDGGGIFFN